MNDPYHNGNGDEANPENQQQILDEINGIKNALGVDANQYTASNP